MARFVTIHDVAADAQVSTATVSRVLNEPWRVSPDARERVTASIAKLGYTPNLRARLLARGDSGTICFLLSNRPFLHSIHTQMLQGAADRANALGVQIVYAACSYLPDTPPSEIEMPRILAARGLIDGVIVAGTNYPNMLQAIDELALPRVLFGTNLIAPGLDRVPAAIYVDDESGGYLAAKHLISLGHKAIRFIGDVTLPWYRRRYEGCARAMREAGLEVHPAIGKRDATDAEIIEAAKAAHVDHFVRALPEGYDFEINEETTNISQGQMQLLTIARAMLAQPPMLILDEATSNVDTHTEVLIQRAMGVLMQGRTSFVIAHRLSTIRDADLILVMDHGDIVEQGTHQELLSKGGFYAELYNSQFDQNGEDQLANASGL